MIHRRIIDGCGRADACGLRTAGRRRLGLAAKLVVTRVDMLQASKPWMTSTATWISDMLRV